MIHKIRKSPPEICGEKFSAEFIKKYNLKPHWKVITLPAKYFMDTIFVKDQVSCFVPDTTEFLVYEFIKQETSRRSRLFKCTHNNCGLVKVSLSKLF